MPTRYNYLIGGLSKVSDANSLPDVVTRISFSYVGEDENGVVGLYNGTILLPEPSSQDFIPFDDLSQEQMIEWIKSFESEEEMKRVVDEKIEERKQHVNNNMPPFI